MGKDRGHQAPRRLSTNLTVVLCPGLLEISPAGERLLDGSFLFSKGYQEGGEGCGKGQGQGHSVCSALRDCRVHTVLTPPPATLPRILQFQVSLARDTLEGVDDE